MVETAVIVTVSYGRSTYRRVSRMAIRLSLIRLVGDKTLNTSTNPLRNKGGYSACLVSEEC